MKNPRLLLVLQLLAIPIVIGIFKLPAEKKWLSLFANGIFLTTALITMTFQGERRSLVRIAGLQFLALAVLPITLLRIISWSKDFNTESLLGLSGKQWHSFSNLSFMLMLGLTAIVVIRTPLKGLPK